MGLEWFCVICIDMEIVFLSCIFFFNVNLLSGYGFGNFYVFVVVVVVLSFFLIMGKNGLI